VTEDALTKLKAARTEQCRLYHARALVQSRFDAGEYPMISVLSADLKEAMARALLNELKEEGK
jgi:outer membrane protein TolC